MSASNKKKLRKELAAASLTQKQQKELAEAKKLKRMSTIFVVAMLAVALIAASILAVRAVNNTGVIDRNTIAATTGKHELNSIQMNYYYTDYVRNTVSNWQTQYGQSFALYMAMMGMDLYTALDKQVQNPTTGETWADYFLQGALDKAKSDYALYDKAVAEGFELPKEKKDEIDYNFEYLELIARYNGYKNTDKYLRALYGYGADVESFKEYTTIVTIASSYYDKYKEALSYDDKAIREHEKDKYDNYTYFDYASYYVSTTDYIKGGTADDKNQITYTDAEKAAALAEAKKIAESLVKSKNLVELDKAIAALEINKENKNAASTKYTGSKYTSVPSAVREWLADKSRKNGDIAMLENVTTSKDADGTEVKTTTGYYVVVFQARDDNLRPLASVRHLLVKFQGGKTNTDGSMTYTDAEKAAAKAEAERLLQVWKDGKATEETFISMIKEYSDDGSATTGGLFEGIHRDSDYVEPFLKWAIDSSRKAGDVELVETQYGYHIMYYVCDEELTYRDYMISEDLRAQDVEKWYQNILGPVRIIAKNKSRLNTDLIIGNLGLF